MTRRATSAGDGTVRSTVPAGEALDSEALRREIELRAYDRYCQRGCEPGGDVADWLEAEQEILAAHATSIQVAAPAAMLSGDDRRAVKAVRARP